MKLDILPMERMDDEMLFTIIWKTILIFIVGTALLRLGGRKSISQMTVPQVVVMIGLGTLLIQPVSGYGLGYTFVAAGVLVALMLLAEYIDLKFDGLETLFTGKAKLVIENGQINLSNLQKLRLTVDKLEARLRQEGISNVEDVEWATIETSGQLGYSLKYSQLPSTKRDIQEILDRLSHIENSIPPSLTKNVSSTSNIFSEIKRNEFEGNQKEPN
jgi:uncharacterized membrane protein YcaP (DUF421 family)